MAHNVTTILTSTMERTIITTKKRTMPTGYRRHILTDEVLLHDKYSAASVRMGDLGLLYGKSRDIERVVRCVCVCVCATIGRVEIIDQ